MGIRSYEILKKLRLSRSEEKSLMLLGVFSLILKCIKGLLVFLGTIVFLFLIIEGMNDLCCYRRLYKV